MPPVCTTYNYAAGKNCIVITTTQGVLQNPSMITWDN